MRSFVDRATLNDQISLKTMPKVISEPGPLSPRNQDGSKLHLEMYLHAKSQGIAKKACRRLSLSVLTVMTTRKMVKIDSRDLGRFSTSILKGQHLSLQCTQSRNWYETGL